jgi:zinc finger BED domain-containing protein 1 (E3 SUMO-protein ligase ZBED1)
LPLYVLQTKSFRDFVYACEPGFKVPCEKTAKGLIHKAYHWSHGQLKSLLNNSVTAIHLTTDLWTSKSRHSYLGVTATWLSSDFKFREVLLSCNHLAHPHTGEVISEELFKIICAWRLEDTVFTIATDNGANMVKGVQQLHENYFNYITHQPCAAHTLQLSVQQGLKQCKAVHYRIKNLQNFFRLPKQAQRLREAQNEINEDTVESPLDVLTDVKTRWNSTYLAWKRVLELHNSMKFVSASLITKPDRASQKEGEKLEKLCLSVDEKE